MRHTGGFAVAAISTKSKLWSLANAKASSKEITPSCSASAPITLSSDALILSLILVNF
ncbi:MAG: hypothetical protein ACI9F2_000600 [Lysobacterales bacterium]|jgi:hypothetical protein